MEQERCEPRLADRSVVDDAVQQGLSSGPPELCAEQVNDAGLLGRVQHHARLRRVARERLLHEDVLPGPDRLQREAGVRVWRRRDREGVGTG